MENNKNNKKLIALFISLLVLCVAIFLVYYAKKLDNYSLSFNQIEFHTILKDNGKEQKIKFEFNDGEDPYYGKIYIPGNYKEPIYLSWVVDSEEDMIIKRHFNKYNNGEYKFNNDSYTFNLVLNNEMIKVTLQIIRTSENIEPLFLEIDESLGLIDDMNSDWIHDTSCYGTATFTNETYYMSIKGRGNSTWTDGLKKPYNITFLDSDYSKKQSISMIDGIKTKKWSLLANYGDPSLLRNKIGYDLANKMSVGLESKYYDIWMNGNYLGNYLVTPKSDYQATEEGFILELDNHTDNEDPQFNLKDNGNAVDTLLFTVKSNESGIDVKDIEEYMQQTWEAIEKYDSDEYLKYIDIDSWARVYLLNELFKNNDVVRGSILMHRDGQSDDNKLTAGPIWDLDNALGALTPFLKKGQSNDEMFSGGCWYISTINWEEGDYCFYQELGKHKDFLKKVQEIYEEYRDSIIDLPNQINKHLDEGYDSFIADFDKWGNERTLYDFYTDYVWDYGGEYSIYYNITNSYGDYYKNLNNYVTARIKFLDENIDNIE